MNLTILKQSSTLVAAALSSTGKSGENGGLSTSAINQEVPNASEKLDLTLEFPSEVTDCSPSLPSVITVSISSPQQMEEQSYGQDLLHLPSSIADDRFRLASEACLEGEGPIWATSAFSAGSVRHRSTLMPQLGKHRSAIDAVKLPKSKAPRITGPEESPVMSESCPVPSGQVQIDADSFGVRFTMDGGFEAGGDYLPAIDLLDLAPQLPHEYYPEFTADLDELESLPDVTDIG